jgi:hypothetical protein
MATFIFRCPTTGANVQGWIADDVSDNDPSFYQSVECLACAQLHFVNAKTGKTIGDDD